jgi:hypothetical protein
MVKIVTSKADFAVMAITVDRVSGGTAFVPSKLAPISGIDD